MTNRQLYVIQQEKKKLQELLGSSIPGRVVRCVTAVARSILLEGPYFYTGRILKPKAKSIGAGVYEIWVEV